MEFYKGTLKNGDEILTVLLVLSKTGDDGFPENDDQPLIIFPADCKLPGNDSWDMVRWFLRREKGFENALKKLNLRMKDSRGSEFKISEIADLARELGANFWPIIVDGEFISATEYDVSLQLGSPGGPGRNEAMDGLMFWTPQCLSEYLNRLRDSEGAEDRNLPELIQEQAEIFFRLYNTAVQNDVWNLDIYNLAEILLHINEENDNGTETQIEELSVLDLEDFIESFDFFDFEDPDIEISKRCHVSNISCIHGYAAVRDLIENRTKSQVSTEELSDLQYLGGNENVVPLAEFSIEAPA
jgi:hypothetical protein